MSKVKIALSKLGYEVPQDGSKNLNYVSKDKNIILKNMKGSKKMSKHILHSYILSRNCRGENNHCAVLTEVKVRLIRLLFRKGRFTQKELAIRFMVGRSTISDIVRYKTWNYMPDYTEGNDYLAASIVRANGTFIISVYAFLRGHSSSIIDEFIGREEAIEQLYADFRHKYPAAFLVFAN